MKQLIKSWLRYTPLAETDAVRAYLASVDGTQSVPDDRSDQTLSPPVCTHMQGDFVYLLCRSVSATNCLELGFASGSTALYMLHAMDEAKGWVTSIDIPEGLYNHFGQQNIDAFGAKDRHRLLLGPSERFMPKLVEEEARFDLIFMDGWKTFDYLAMDLFFAVRLLRTGGYLVFDDAHMPSVRKACAMISSHYGLKEAHYDAFNMTFRTRLATRMASNTRWLPCRAFQLTTPMAEQRVTRDWDFFPRF